MPVVLRVDQGSRPLIEPEGQAFVADHATDELVTIPHFRVAAETRAVDPQPKAVLDLGAGNERDARFKAQACLLFG